MGGKEGFVWKCGSLIWLIIFFFFFFFSCRLLGRVERWCGGLGVWGMRVGG